MLVCRNILFLYIPLIPPPKTKPHRPGTKGQLFSGFQEVFGVATVHQHFLGFKSPNYTQLDVITIDELPGTSKQEYTQ